MAGRWPREQTASLVQVRSPTHPEESLILTLSSLVSRWPVTIFHKMFPASNVVNLFPFEEIYGCASPDA